MLAILASFGPSHDPATKGVMPVTIRLRMAHVLIEGRVGVGWGMWEHSHKLKLIY